ncbi:T9SS type A sorting domain-containing protein [Flavobacterium sp. xlx-214]|uniref:T9SS type A sorting domain-containing protein n=1 Tax=unclassified Flavobacterium TaxID=196869 RepID=UPI0013D49CAC|nr:MULTISPECIES: T9SS type A sorting domain-containing protein [unclassified Flavobacterium]MBA5793764.1 T9SS type A sorting domain-containing protein [Flavobacterium sp. xlx-221]QMI83215.1 T9SS type A sorting domain-containing protein [Flavobacterium sp. xlx-214]
MRKIITFLFLVFSICASAQETLNTMFYNLFKFPNSLPQNRQLILRDILDEYKPDLFMVCELATENAANLILNTSLQNQTDLFARAAFTPDLTDLADPLQTMVFYNTRKLTLVGQQKLPTVYRDINQYSFKVNVDPTNPIYLEVFVAHLKSSTGTAEQQMRLQMVQQVTQALQNLTQPNTYVLFAGDFNFYKSTEPGYQEILNPANAIKLIDPINTPGNWQNNAAFSPIHTQSTRVSNAGFGGGANSGASGGLDDRFDFIMMSENFSNSARFQYVSNTYKAYGNNGNCFDKDVKDPTCTGVFSQTLRNNLYNMSDHLPVVMQFLINEPLKIPSFSTKQLMWFESSNVAESEVMIGIDDSKLNDNSQLLIYNQIGQLLQTINIDKQKSIVISTQKLASGIYFIKLNSNVSVLKFIKK